VISITKPSWKPVTSGVPQGSILWSTLPNIFIKHLDDGQAAPLANLQAIQNWDEWLMHQRVVLPFRGTLQAGVLGQENLIKSKKGKCQILNLVRNNPRHQGKLRLTAGKQLGRAGSGGYWWIPS